jgi:hypothetical protein
MRRKTGLTWRRRYVTAGLLALTLGGVLAIAAVAGTSHSGRAKAIRALKVTTAADSCGYPNTTSNATTFPRRAVTFNESTVLKGFSPAAGAFLGDEIIAYYSDEHALTLGGTGADTSTSANGNDDLAPNTGADVNDPSLRPLKPVLFISEITSTSQSSVPQSGGPEQGDWQANALHNQTGHAPNAIYGSYKPSGAADPPKNDRKDGSRTFPANLQNEGYTAQIVWNTASLGLQDGKIYKLQFMVHDGDQNKAGGDVGEGCTSVLTPGLTTTATNNTATTQATIGVDQIHDTLHVTNVAAGTSVSATFKAYAPATAGGNDAVCTGTPENTSTTTRTGPGDLDSTPFSPATTGVYKWQATVTIGTKVTALGCGDTTNGNAEVSFVKKKPTDTYTGQKLDVTDHALIHGFISGGGPSTVRFRLYDNPQCLTGDATHNLLFDETQTIDDTTGEVSSSAFSVQNQTTTDKTFYWKVEFGGNAYNDASTSACGVENFTIHPDGTGTDP